MPKIKTKNKDREYLKKCLDYLVALDCVLEEQSPEWYSRADLIAEINDFYIELEYDKELNEIIGETAGRYQVNLYDGVFR